MNSSRPVCKFFQKGCCTRGDACSFSHSGLGGANQLSSSCLPAGALPSIHGQLTKAATEFWFPESRNCSCCQGFKHGCTCCTGKETSCSTCSCPSSGSDQQPALRTETECFPLPPPPRQGQHHVVVDLPPGTHVVSIDVECAATSADHNSRAVCSVGMVDEFGRPLLNSLVKPGAAQGVMSYLTPLTGVTREDVEVRGVSLPEVLAQVRSLLTPSTVIVGQNISKDVQWLGLKEGTDFGSLIDLTGLFRVWSEKHQAYTCFSQDHVARVWLGQQDRPHHDALQDASLAMSLFFAYRSVQEDLTRLKHLQHLTMTAPRTPSFAAVTGSIEGCCLGHRKTCTCGAGFIYS